MSKMRRDSRGKVVSADMAVYEKKPAAPARPALHPWRPTVEIPFVCIYFCTTITGTVMSNLVLERTCINALGYSPETCALLQEQGEKPQEIQDLETEVQQYATLVNTGKSLLEGLVPAVLALFLGVWSNTHGRKPLVLWPTFGYVLFMALMLLYSFMSSLGPWWYMLTPLPYALAGGGSTFTTGVLCLLNDIVAPEQKIVRFALLTSSMYVFMIIGSLTATYAYAALGINNFLIMATVIAMFGFLFTAFCIPESVPNPAGGGICSIFDFTLAKAMVRTIAKKRASYGRAIILLIVVINCLDIFVNNGNGHVDYLYVRQKLGWTLHEQSIFNAVNTAIMVTGLMSGVVLLQRVCKLSDGVTAMISYVACITEALVRGLATASWMMYMGSAISVFRGVSFPVIRVIVAKRAPALEVANVYAFMSAVDAVSPLIAPLLYNLLYRQTLDTVIGAVYFMNASFYVVCFCLMGLAHYLMDRYPLKRVSLDNSKSTEVYSTKI